MSEKKFERIEYSPMRKAISKAMHQSLMSGSQLTLGMTIDASNLLKIRKEIKENYRTLGVANASINEIIIYVLSRTIKKYPTLNGHIGDGYFDKYEEAHIAFAVDGPKGLITPTIWDASLKTLTEISNDSKTLIEKAKNNKLRLSDIQGGTFTITNLGLSGVQFFTPIINPPQLAIIGVGSPIMRLKMIEEKIIEYPELTLSLTMDHGPNDGAIGAKFLGELAKDLEKIDNSIIKSV